MSLKDRTQRLDEICRANPRSIRLDALIYSSRISKEAFHRLQQASRRYLSACLRLSSAIEDEAELMECMERAYPLENLTPNGKLMPKAWLNDEYNQFLKAFASVLNDLHIDSFVEEYRLPTLRYKASPKIANQAHGARPYATEKMHNEMWISNRNADVIGLHVLIFGDTDHNHLQFYKTPMNYSEEWMRPVSDFSSVAPLLKNYSPIELAPERGVVYAFEGSAVHASNISPEAFGRISVETFAVLKKKIPCVATEVAPDSRQVDFSLTPSDFHRVGSSLEVEVLESLSGVVEIKQLRDSLRRSG